MEKGFHWPGQGFITGLDEKLGNTKEKYFFFSDKHTYFVTYRLLCKSQNELV